MEDYPSLAEGNGLENRQTCKSVRGFESHILLRFRGIAAIMAKITGSIPVGTIQYILGSYSRGLRGRFAKSLGREIGAWVRIPYSPYIELFS